MITGGEPLLYPSMATITRRLRDAGRFITIETAGTVDQDVQCDLLSISPKLASSAPNPQSHPKWHDVHNARRHQPDLIRSWLDRFEVQIKFVICSPDDLQALEQWIAEIGCIKPSQIWLMPEGVTIEAMEDRTQWLKPWAESHGYHFCPRSHIYWYGNRRGT